MKRAAMVVMALAGCFGPPRTGGRPYTARAHHASAGVTDADLYASTLRIFDDAGLELREKDKDSGIITTKFVQIGSAEGDATYLIYHAWHVRIEEGSLWVGIDCMMTHYETMAPESGPLPCDGRTRRQAWIDQADDLAAKINADAETRAVKRKSRESAASE